VHLLGSLDDALLFEPVQVVFDRAVGTTRDPGDVAHARRTLMLSYKAANGVEYAALRDRKQRGDL
jgi:hypothetical protein